MTGPGKMRLFDMDEPPPARPNLLEQPLASGVGVVRGDLAGNVLAIELDRRRLSQVRPAVLSAQLTEAIQQLQRRADDARTRLIRQRNRKV